jgi:pimeloyl-ACP methyl ester carboxylesterase
LSYQERSYTSRDGLTLYFREYGAGDDVLLCLHGLTRNCKDFENLAESLSDRWRVITPDIRGRGKSDRDPKWKQYLPPTYVADAWALMDELGISSVAVLGTSLGGLMAMIMAEQHPRRIRGVILNDIGAEVPPEAVARILEYAGRTPPQANWAEAEAIVRENYGLAYPDESDEFWARQTRLAWVEREDGKVEPDCDPRIGDALRHAAKSAGLVRFLRTIGVRRLKDVNLDPWDNFRAMTMPVLVLRGEISDVLPEQTVQAMQSAKPDLQVATIPRRGHAPTLDEPEAREAIGGFLAGLS